MKISCFLRNNGKVVKFIYAKTFKVLDFIVELYICIQMAFNA